MPKSRYEDLQDRLRNPGALCPENLLDLLHECEAACTRCPAWEGATQTVLGSGPASARLMIVGGRPGAEEDGTGRSFAGSERDVLHQVLKRAGIGLQDVYFTNAVKHRSPATAQEDVAEAREALAEEIDACRRWFEGEVAIVKPEVILCVGSLAAKAVLGLDVDLPRERGMVFHPGFVGVVMVTVHPSWVLMQPEDRRERAMKELVEELYEVAEFLGVSDPFKGRDELAQL
jgi:uracil-DNA glycosylase family 4